MNEVVRTKSGKTIEIYHNLFSYKERCDIYHFAKNLSFTVSGDHVYSKLTNQLACNLSKNDVEKIPFLTNPLVQEVIRKNNLSNVFQCRINLSNCSEYNTVHYDNSKVTLLYYVNMEWKLEWGGQTLFLNEDLTKVEHCSLTEPGKLIVFEGSIPHMLVNPTIYAEESRFVFVLQMN